MRREVDNWALYMVKFSGVDDSGREWVQGMPLATVDEIIAGKEAMRKAEEDVGKAQNLLHEWRKRMGAKMFHPDDGWVFRNWGDNTKALIDSRGEVYGIIDEYGKVSYCGKYMKFSHLNPSYPTIYEDGIGYGDRICLGGWNVERFVKVVAILDRSNKEAILSDKDNPRKVFLDRVKDIPYLECEERKVWNDMIIKFESDTEFPFYYVGDRLFTNKDTDLVVTNQTTDKPYKQPKTAADLVDDALENRGGCGCLTSIIILGIVGVAAWLVSHHILF